MVYGLEEGLYSVQCTCVQYVRETNIGVRINSRLLSPPLRCPL
jgi:hypothetical protein